MLKKVDEKLWQAFVPEARKLIASILEQGYSLTMVGGASRHYLQTGTFPHDIDMEIRHPGHFQGSEWEEKLKLLAKNLEDEGYEVMELPFSVMRIPLAGASTTLEFSSPRIEVFFSDGKKGLGHKNFQASLNSDLDDATAFKRRDFTINAIGIELKIEGKNICPELCDPFQGVVDLQKGILRAVGEDFFRDPVRLYRLLRFKRTLKFKIHPDLEAELGKFNLSDPALFYFFSEGQKTAFFSFAKDLFAFVDRCHIPVGVGLMELKFLSGVEGHDETIFKHKEELLLAVIGARPARTSLQELESFVRAGQFKLGFFRNCYTYVEALKGPDDAETLKNIHSSLKKIKEHLPKLTPFLPRALLDRQNKILQVK